MNKLLNAVFAIGRAIKWVALGIVSIVVGIYKFATDYCYRNDFIIKYWTFKTKMVVYILIPLIIITGIAIKVRGPQLWDCVWEQIDVGRDTEFSFVTGSCVIDTGKVDDAGEVIWNKVNRDVPVGDFGA